MRERERQAERQRDRERAWTQYEKMVYSRNTSLKQLLYIHVVLRSLYSTSLVSYMVIPPY